MIVAYTVQNTKMHINPNHIIYMKERGFGAIRYLDLLLTTNERVELKEDERNTKAFNELLKHEV